MKNLLLAIMLVSRLALGQIAIPYDACDFSLGTPTAPVDPKAEKARQIVETNCFKCHSGPGAGTGGIADMADLKSLISDGFVVPNNSAGSPIYDAVKTDRMPKGPAKVKLSADDKEAIKAWIDEGAKSWDPEEPPPLPAGFIQYEHELACMLQDAYKLDEKKRGDAANYEWFLLTNIYNTGDKTKFQNLGWALDIALNSTAINLSKNKAAANPFNASKVDKDGIIRRVFAPQAVKDAVKDFDDRLLVDAQYPFRILYQKGTYKPRRIREQIDLMEKELERLTGRVQPWVRADFALNEIYNKQYYEFIGIDDKRQKQDDIEKIFGVDANQAIFNLEVDSLAAHVSGVANNNRIMHRYDAQYTIGGNDVYTSFWKTFDVINEIDRRNFFAFPLGPQGVRFDNFKTDLLFDFDAGESIVGMPNGEMLFLVSLSNGKLIREADTTVVYNPGNVHPFIGSRPTAITTGVGCRGCHAGGMNRIVDQGLSYAVGNTAISAEEYNVIKQIYPVQKVWDTAFASFSASFQTAVGQYVKSPVALVSATEPATQATRTFLDYLALKDAAGELNVTEADLQSCLDKEDDIARAINLTGQYGKVSRDGFNAQFGNIAQKCGYGVQVKFKKVGPPPPPIHRDCNYKFKNNSSYRVQYRMDFGKFGSTSVLLFPGDDKTFTFINEDSVEGDIEDFEYATKEYSGWGSNKLLKGGHISGCRDYEFYDNGGKPGIR